MVRFFYELKKEVDSRVGNEVYQDDMDALRDQISQGVNAVATDARAILCTGFAYHAYCHPSAPSYRRSYLDINFPRFDKEGLLSTLSYGWLRGELEELAVLTAENAITRDRGVNQLEERHLIRRRGAFQHLMRLTEHYHAQDVASLASQTFGCLYELQLTLQEIIDFAKVLQEVKHES
jgi:hypothetical protein